eukprot:GHVR01119521.1.p1 GENE.GHVR01119521.1~~GHVR01119521.1.p1  ORF type:complete len:123 (-),score=22.00 GHVR01119521.1:322-690(-)
MFLFGCGMAIVEQFLFLYLMEVFDVTSNFLGMVIVVMTIFEVPVFFYDKVIFAKFSMKGLLVLSHVTFVVRMLGYTLVPKEHPWLVLLLEPLHGINYAAMWSVAVSLARSLAPEGKEATMQP